MKKLIKILIIIVITLIIIVIGKYLYKQEISNQKLDKYNFKMLEYAKETIQNLSEDNKNTKLSGLKEFNEKFGANIHSIDNRYCYYVGYNGNKNIFEFGFRLHSLLYKLKYGGEYYTYPNIIRPKKLPADCGNGYGIEARCVDFVYDDFIYTINNPCKK